ncbi:cyclic pyranopterin phosphate synthase [Methanocalculus alkaliphilus]|uniref:GTP 3',8-cyclase MoaA n=1 Tax=Methanocalculus alkaliphilus TaxID=768730 RepID=UPI00209F7127|nr:GTP 3',8-cyclase MoaA [Methanocalculus alkaliphilus]MCP1714553.1 cyclic pyranopterin phosphate synthase [Methanocalculus alkaliphilus]
MPALIDPYGRPVTNVRISLTPACNLNCIYCHAEGEKEAGRLMTTDEIINIIGAVTRYPIRSIKFTGGEPTLRDDLVEIIGSVPSRVESSMTTNGTLLADQAYDLKKAGLSRVNISLDTLQNDRYITITGKDLLSDVLAGIDASLDAGLTPVKLNVVLLKGMNEDELPDFFDFVRGNRDLVLQIIELMHFNNCDSHAELNGIEDQIASEATEVLTRRMHHRKKYCVDGAEVEVVRPLHNTEFCAHCNRLRITSDGRLKPCLLRTDNEIDIRGKNGQELDELIQKAVSLRSPFYE